MTPRSHCFHCIIMEYIHRHYESDPGNDLAVISALMEVQGDLLASMPPEVKIRAIGVVRDNMEMLLFKVADDAWKNSRDYDWMMAKEPATETRN